jgi:hypothetical protein
VCVLVRHHGVTGLEYTVFEVYYWPRRRGPQCGVSSVVSASDSRTPFKARRAGSASAPWWNWRISSDVGNGANQKEKRISLIVKTGCAPHDDTSTVVTVLEPVVDLHNSFLRTRLGAGGRSPSRVDRGKSETPEANGRDPRPGGGESGRCNPSRPSTDTKLKGRSRSIVVWYMPRPPPCSNPAASGECQCRPVVRLRALQRRRLHQ